MNSQDYLKRQTQINKKLDNDVESIDNRKKEVSRVTNLVTNTESYLENREKAFEEETSLNSQDVEFLFFAVALQCCRCFLQPKVQLEFDKIPQKMRHSAQKDGNVEFSKGKKMAEKYPDKSDIFLLPVPYDAMEGTKDVYIPGVTEVGKNICGYNHHTATLGHDPVLGYFVGTINILSRTITFNTPLWDTNLVYMEEGAIRRQVVGMPTTFMQAVNSAISSAREDITRVIAAIIRQEMHMQSDKYTKHGLPIPLLSPDKAQILLKKGWNSNELERLQKLIQTDVAIIGIQASASYLINIMIETLYKICYFETDKDNSLLEVKIRKILSYSNAIASGSNLIQTALSQDINNLDIGGLIVTINRIVTDKKFIEQIKDEFIF